MSISKGKWLPGPGGVILDKEFCKICNRGFAHQKYLDKHLLSTIHFKRSLLCKAKSNKLLANSFDYLSDDDMPTSYSTRLRQKQRSCKNKNLVDNMKMKSNDGHSGDQMELVGHGDNNVICPTCFISVRKGMMGKHIISYFHNQGILSTDRRTAPEMNLILQNIQDVMHSMPYQCESCKYYFSQKENLIDHFKKVHLYEEKNTFNPSFNWKCSACSNSIVPLNSSNFLEHFTEELHLKIEEAIFKSIPIIIHKIKLHICTHCDRKFLLNRALHFHLKNTHNEIVEQESEITKLQLETNNNHIITKTKPKMIHLSSKKKLKKSAKITNITVSKNIVSKNADMFNCEHCQATFKLNSSLNKHMARVHSIKTLYKCTVCDYVTNKLSHHFRHSRVHEKERERPFTCTVCEKTFYDDWGLKHHRKIHFGKNVQCTFKNCSFRGRSNSEVKVHQLTHEEARNFICTRDNCVYKSKTLSNLKRHQKIMHNLDKVKVKVKVTSKTETEG